MTKLLPSIAIALALTAGVVAPVMASDSLTSSDSSFNSELILQSLRDKGVNAVDVAQQFSGRVKATVLLDNGQEAIQYFDQDSLQQIGGAADATRVLTKLDVQRTAPVVSLDSLTHDDAYVAN